jgi:ABC-type amino acid transport substrate-binding protein
MKKNDSRFSIRGRMLPWLLAVLVVAASPPPGATAGPIVERIQAGQALRVGIHPDYWPFSYTGPRGRRGVDIDIARLLADSLQVPLTLVVPRRFTDLISMADARQVDVVIAGLSRTFQRARRVDFSDAYYHTGVAILLNRQIAADIGIADASSYEAVLETLRYLNKEAQLKVIVAAGKAPEESAQLFFPRARIIPIEVDKGNDACIQALDHGRGHIFVHDLIYLKHWVATHPGQAFKLQLIEPPYKSDSFGFAVPKGNLDFVAMLNVFIEAKLLNEGYLDRFMAEHYTMK